MNKTVKIDFRVSEYEKKLLQSRVRKTKMKLSEFCRKAVFDKKIIHVEGLTECLYELNKIGTNVNQIAVAANQGRDISSTLPVIQSRLAKIFDHIEEMLGGDGHSDSETDQRPEG